METTLEGFRKFLENDKMQDSYTKEQLLEHIDILLLPKERAQLSLFFTMGQAMQAGVSNKNFDEYLEHFKNMK